MFGIKVKHRYPKNSFTLWLRPLPFRQLNLKVSLRRKVKEFLAKELFDLVVSAGLTPLT
jgi:hypothetical protein